MDADPDLDLTELIDDARHREAVASRSRQRWLRQQAEEDATLAGVFADALTNRAVLTVRTTTGRSHQGTVRQVGRDYVALDTEAGVVALTLDAVTAVRVEPSLRAEPPAGRRVGADLLLAEMLAEALADQPRVGIGLRGDPEMITGKLRAVGLDVVTVAVEARLIYVSLSAVSEVSFFASA